MHVCPVALARAASSTSARPRLPVLIIGSGLGGLTLAHALQARQIPYRLFERDSAFEPRAQGYRISVDETGANGLRSALAATPELFEEFERTCGEQHPPGGRLDAVSGEVLGKGVIGMIGAGGPGMIWALASRFLGRKASGWYSWLWSLIPFSSAPAATSTPSPHRIVLPPNPSPKSYQVDRRVLRTLLTRSQKEHITYSATFSSYTLESDRVVAHFNDGQAVAGSLLVGADGIRSAVARQLLGSALADPRDMGVKIIYGKTPLTAEVEAGLHPTLRKGTSFVVEAHDVVRRSGTSTAGNVDSEDLAGPSMGKKLLLVQECMRFNHQSPGVPHDYVFWALAGRRDTIDGAEVHTSAKGGSGAAATALRLTAHWDPRIRILMEQQAPTETASLRMTTSDPTGAPVWNTQSRVTVLGDAIHCMPPTGGQGANAAMHDAALLALALGQETGSGDCHNDGWSVETVRAYEDAMRYNIGDVVGMACIGANRIMGADIPP